MIVRFSVQNYRILRLVQDLELGRFQVLVGPNASGKTTFLQMLDFLKACLIDGPQRAVEAQAPEFRDLTFQRQGGAITMEVVLQLPDRESAAPAYYGYRLVLTQDPTAGIQLDQEELRLLERPAAAQPGFPGLALHGPRRDGLLLLRRTRTGNCLYYRENGTYQDTFSFGREKTVLANTPPDLERYPSANAVRSFLMQGVRYVQLNSRAMRLPCPATRPTELELDGTNLARVVGRLRQSASADDRLERWAAHLRYALPDLREIGWARREADNAEYLVLHYDDGLACPSWLASDGTLRMLALTLPAFLPPTAGTYLVEEPENGVHPMGLEIILRSLSAIPEAQVLVTTHSPLVVDQVGREALLCFDRGATGARITPGLSHPALADWDGSPDLALVFAAGVLG